MNCNQRQPPFFNCLGIGQTFAILLIYFFVEQNKQTKNEEVEFGWTGGVGCGGGNRVRVVKLKALADPFHPISQMIRFLFCDFHNHSTALTAQLSLPRLFNFSLYTYLSWISNHYHLFNMWEERCI